jgi:hypothetical protein
LGKTNSGSGIYFYRSKKIEVYVGLSPISGLRNKFSKFPEWVVVRGGRGQLEEAGNPSERVVVGGGRVKGWGPKSNHFYQQVHPPLALELHHTPPFSLDPSLHHPPSQNLVLLGSTPLTPPFKSSASYPFNWRRGWFPPPLLYTIPLYPPSRGTV